MIKETIILPSLGYPYGGKIEGTSITVRPLTTRAYKDFIVNPSEEGVVNLVGSCLVDCPVRADDLVYQDQLAVYLKIRAISMGSLVPAYSICPECKERNEEQWDIMQLKCNYLELDEYPVHIKLPVCGKQVHVTIPTPRTQRRAQEEAQKRAKLFDKKISDFLTVFQTVSVLSVEGVDDMVGKADWYNELPLKDAVFIDAVLDRIQDFGIETVHTVACHKCGHSYRVPIQISPDFFRPDIGSIGGIKTAQGTLEKGPTDADEA